MPAPSSRRSLDTPVQPGLAQLNLAHSPGGLMSRHAVLACLLGLLAILSAAADRKPAAAAKEPPEGVLPAGADGRPLNLDFETGTLKDWTAEGDAFKDQPIKGDTVAPRRGDMASQ